MKTSLLLFAAFAAPAFAASEDPIPVSYSKDRYAEMAKQSPFGVETKPPTPAPPEADPFANIVLRGLGSDYVVIQRTGDDHTIRLVGDETKEGFTVKQVNWSDVPGGSTVILAAGGKEGPVKFDQNLVHPAASSAVATHRPPSGPQPSKYTSGTPMKATGNQPLTKTVIPKPTYLPAVQPNAVPKPAYGAPNTAKPAADATGGRIRLRNIPGSR